ncbi:MAG: dihydropteroate synthase [Candidatus Poribacteria bacterium]|nr:dihydropteroate synthase [Candidatus Poribacteria bacterium]
MTQTLRCRDRELDYSHRTLVMGVLNVTPDSFSDGGLYLTPDAAISRARQLVVDGAHILDIGGESSRPGAEPVGADEELRRVLPVVEAAVQTEAVVSIDTYKASVARACLERGAHLINDISAMRDPEMASVVAEFDAAVCLMHMRGDPKTMQRHPTYDDAVTEIADYLTERARYAESQGIRRESILLDPGIGFGKTLDHNLQLLRQMNRFGELGYPILVGASRKSFLGKLLGGAAETERLEGTAASVAVAISRGANVVRVHDLPFIAGVVRVADAIVHGGTTVPSP